MIKLIKLGFLLCGLAFGLAAFPVFAQDAATKEVQVNKKPFQDLAGLFRLMIETKQIDLSQPFSVSLKGVLTKESRFDRRNSKFVTEEGSAEMIEIGKSFIEAIGDSGMLAYLRQLGIEQINLTLGQDDSQAYLRITSEQESRERANRTASHLASMIKFLQLADAQGMKKLDENSKFLIKGAQASSEGNKMILDFSYQKSDVHELIKQELEKYKR